MRHTDVMSVDEFIRATEPGTLLLLGDDAEEAMEQWSREAKAICDRQGHVTDADRYPVWALCEVLPTNP